MDERLALTQGLVVLAYTPAGYLGVISSLFVLLGGLVSTRCMSGKIAFMRGSHKNVQIAVICLYLNVRSLPSLQLWQLVSFMPSSVCTSRLHLPR